MSTVMPNMDELLDHLIGQNLRPQVQAKVQARLETEVRRVIDELTTHPLPRNVETPETPKTPKPKAAKPVDTESTWQEQVVNYVRKHGPSRMSDVARALNVKPTTLGYAFRKAISDRQLRKVRKGLYAVRAQARR